MIAPEEIVPALESVLADEAVFVSNLQMMERAEDLTFDIFAKSLVAQVAAFGVSKTQ
jgi:hypothetical protein